MTMNEKKKMIITIATTTLFESILSLILCGIQVWQKPSTFSFNLPSIWWIQVNVRILEHKLKMSMGVCCACWKFCMLVMWLVLECFIKRIDSVQPLSRCNSCHWIFAANMYQSCMNAQSLSLSLVLVLLLRLLHHSYTMNCSFMV